MKKVTYNGPVVNLGRFGFIDKGATLSMWEFEYDGIASDANYTLTDKVPSADEVAIAAKVRPLGTSGFDLRTIPWEHRTLFKMLQARMSTRQLRAIILAIKEVGGAPRAIEEGEDRIALVDCVVAEARRMSWDKITKAERLALSTTASDVPAGPPPLDPDAEPSGGNDSDNDQPAPQTRTRQRLKIA